jgi:hypothetical protein
MFEGHSWGDCLTVTTKNLSYVELQPGLYKFDIGYLKNMDRYLVDFRLSLYSKSIRGDLCEKISITHKNKENTILDKKDLFLKHKRDFRGDDDAFYYNKSQITLREESSILLNCKNITSFNFFVDSLSFNYFTEVECIFCSRSGYLYYIIMCLDTIKRFPLDVFKLILNYIEI